MTMGSWIDRLLDFVIPRFCPICGKRLAPNEAQLCSSCLMELPYTGFLERPYDNLVADRLYGKIRNFERGASLFYYMYDDRRQLLFDLKYHNHPLNFYRHINSLIVKASEFSLAFYYIFNFFILFL